MNFHSTGADDDVTALSTQYAIPAPKKDIERALAEARRVRAVGDDVHQLVQVESVAALRATGESARNIAATVGMSKSAVGRLLRQHASFFEPEVARVEDPEVVRCVRRAWGGGWRALGPVPTVNQLIADGERNPPRRRMTEELDRASAEPGSDWPYHLTAYKFVWDQWATRDSIVTALSQSAWMADSVRESGGKWWSAVERVCEALREAHSLEEFDRALRALSVLADREGCWFELVEPPAGASPGAY